MLFSLSKSTRIEAERVRSQPFLHDTLHWIHGSDLETNSPIDRTFSPSSSSTDFLGKIRPSAEERLKVERVGDY